MTEHPAICILPASEGAPYVGNGVRRCDANIFQITYNFLLFAEEGRNTVKYHGNTMAIATDFHLVYDYEVSY